VFDRYGIIFGIIVSIIVHGVLLIAVKGLPVYLEKKPRTIEEYTEVELIKRSIPPPPIPKDKKPLHDEVLKEKIAPRPLQLPPALYVRALESRVKEMSLGKSPRLPDVEIELPTASARPEIDTGYTIKMSERLVHAAVEKLEKSPLPTGGIAGVVIPMRAGSLERKELQIEVPEVLTKIARLAPPSPREVTRSKKLPSARELFQIKGPAGERKVTYRPSKPPAVELEAETEIVLKFWVLPNGEVGRIIPIKKAEPVLEAKAIGYLKEWRFNPLSPDEAQVEQEGIIPVRFTIK